MKIGDNLRCIERYSDFTGEVFLEIGKIYEICKIGYGGVHISLDDKHVISFDNLFDHKTDLQGEIWCHFEQPIHRRKRIAKYFRENICNIKN
jgi:hypothetical protein